MDGGSILRAMEIWREKIGQDYVTWKETIMKESVLFSTSKCTCPIVQARACFIQLRSCVAYNRASLTRVTKSVVIAKSKKNSASWIRTWDKKFIN